ncbi:MAG: FxsA family protein [Pseudorhodoplanes sp.]|jgi:UPF0716 protein FxsA
MPVGRLILLGLLGLVVAEAAVFLTVAQVIGSLPALVLLFASSILGGLVLGRMGRRLAGRLADMMSRRDLSATEASGGLLTMIGGILLVLPGFLTDIAGLLLLVPAIQRKLIDAPQFRRTRPGGEVLELDRSQWRDLPDSHIEERNAKGARLNGRQKAPRETS